MNIDKLTKIAINEARKSPHRQRIGAVIFDKNGIVSSGYNQVRSARSLTKKFIRWPHSIHAEIDAIIKAKVSLKNKNIIVIRLNKQGIFRLAKPCQHCQLYIEHVGITGILYSTNEGAIKQLL